MTRGACLVTGCAGFVGGHLAERLLREDHPVIGVDDLSSGSRETLDLLREFKNFRFLRNDFTAPGLLDRVLDIAGELAAVFHLAALVSVPRSLTAPEETLRVNHEAVAALHADCRRRGVPAFVFAGSAAEYGDCERLPLAEDDADEAVRHLSPYGRSKWLTTRHIEASGYGCSLRFFNIFGTRQPADSPYSGVVTLFADRALKGEPLTILGTGSQARDFLYVDDAVDAYLAAAGLDSRASAPLTGTYNVATGEGTYIQELAETILELAGGGEIRHAPPRDGDICWSVADVSKLAASGLFTPRTPLGEGLKRTLDWMRRNTALTDRAPTGLNRTR